MQLLIVQGEDRERCAALFRSGLAAFRSFHGLMPLDSHERPPTWVAVLPFLQAPSTGIVRPAGSTKWICGAGAWFYEGAAGRPALERLAAGTEPERSPEAWLKEIDGIFTIALGDDATGRVTVLTDILGSMHIYTAQAGPCLLVSTSSLILAALTRPAWDRVACREFLGTGTIFEARTMFAGIEKLQPAGVYEFERGRPVSSRKYWTLADRMYDRTPERGTVPELAAALEGAVKAAGRNYPNPVLDLTGGFDSRAVLGAMLRAGLNFDTVVSGPADSGDVTASKAIAERFHLRHHHNSRGFESAHEWWEQAKEAFAVCDGEYNILMYAGTLRTQMRMAADFDATINGSNGEICKGYWWELLFPRTRWRTHFDAHAVAAGRFVYDPEIPGLLAGGSGESLADLFSGIIERASAGFEGLPNTAKLDNVYLTLRMQRWQGRLASATSHIWPCIMPFAFRRPIEVAISAPPFRRLRNRMARRLIEYQNPELASLPLADGYPAVPLRLTTVPKFWPLVADATESAGRRVRRSLGRKPAGVPRKYTLPFSLAELWREEEVRELLDPPRMASRELYDPKTLASVIGGSRQESFPKPQTVCRILVIEMLARSAQRSTSCKSVFT